MNCLAPCVLLCASLCLCVCALCGSRRLSDSVRSICTARCSYWSMLADWRSMTAVPIGWIYTVVFGRDTSCLYEPGQSKPGLGKPDAG